MPSPHGHRACNVAEGRQWSVPGQGQRRGPSAGGHRGRNGTESPGRGRAAPVKGRPVSVKHRNLGARDFRTSRSKKKVSPSCFFEALPNPAASEPYSPRSESEGARESLLSLHSLRTRPGTPPPVLRRRDPTWERRPRSAGERRGSTSAHPPNRTGPRALLNDRTTTASDRSELCKAAGVPGNTAALRS